MTRPLRLLFVCVVALLCATTPVRADEEPAAEDIAAAQRLLAAARAQASRDCTGASEVLVRILCSGKIRIGLRTFYPGFSVRERDGKFQGFERDVAQRVADFIGVDLVEVPVDPKNRIPMLAEGQVDLIIATLGHTPLRDPEVRFVRPHYFLSQTVVVGAQGSLVSDWKSLGGHTACPR